MSCTEDSISLRNFTFCPSVQQNPCRSFRSKWNYWLLNLLTTCKLFKTYNFLFTSMFTEWTEWNVQSSSLFTCLSISHTHTHKYTVYIHTHNPIPWNVSSLCFHVSNLYTYIGVGECAPSEFDTGIENPEWSWTKLSHLPLRCCASWVHQVAMQTSE